MADQFAHFRAVLDALPYGIMVGDPNALTVHYINQHLLDMVGADPQPGEQMSYRDFLPGYQEWQGKGRAEIAAKEGAHWFRREVQRRDGTQFVAECVVRPFPIAGKGHVIFAVRDLSEEQHQVDYLEQLIHTLAHLDGPDFFQMLAERIAIAVGMKYCFVGRLLESERVRMVVYWEDGKEGEPYEYDLEGTPCQQLKDKPSLVYPTGMQDEFGEEHFIAEKNIDSYLGIGLFDPDGTWIGHIAILHDEPLLEHQQALSLLQAYAPLVASQLHKQISAEKTRMMEAQLHQAQKLESVGLLAGGIAHDFNNLLTTMMGSVELATMALPTESPVHRNLDLIRQSASQAAQLCREILAYAGKGQLAMQDLDLSSLIADMRHLLNAVPEDKTPLELRLGEDLPQVHVDRAQLSQVVMNLVRNASEAVSSGGGRIRVSTYQRNLEDSENRRVVLGKDAVPGTYVCLRVSDTGVGIDEPDLDRIFDPFFSTKAEGRGLGLASTLGVVNSANGVIEIASKPDLGTDICVLLPAVDVATEAEEPAPRAAEDPAQMDGLHILVVDDDRQVLETVSTMLRQCGAEVSTANDGVEAVNAVQKASEVAAQAGSDACASRIDCVLMDLTMPRMDGVSAYLEIERLDADLPVVMMSGYNESDLTSRLNGSAQVRFVHKPFTAEQLTDMISEIARPTV